MSLFFRAKIFAASHACTVFGLATELAAVKIPRLMTIVIWLLIGAVGLAARGVAAQDQPLQGYEQKVKAGLVYNFIKYTAWPKSRSKQEAANFNICLFGADSFGAFLAPLNGRTAQLNTIAIAHIANINAVANCHVLVIHSGEKEKMAELLQYVKGKPILTISEMAEFAKRGGMIEMAKQEEKISININKRALEQAGLDIQPHMLRLAVVVQ